MSTAKCQLAATIWTTDGQFMSGACVITNSEDACIIVMRASSMSAANITQFDQYAWLISQLEAANAMLAMAMTLQGIYADDEELVEVFVCLKELEHKRLPYGSPYPYVVGQCNLLVLLHNSRCIQPWFKHTC